MKSKTTKKTLLMASDSVELVREGLSVKKVARWNVYLVLAFFEIVLRARKLDLIFFLKSVFQPTFFW